MAKGIDVSKWQGVIDWKKVKNAGIEFAMLRCGYGRSAGQQDAKFEANYKGAKAAGVPVGAYHYSYATNVEQAKAEAKYCLSLIKGKQFEYPICFDIEDKTQRNLGKATISNIIRAFCETLEKEGYYVTLYANLDWLNNRIDEDCKKRYDIWLAQWSSKPTYKGSFGMWQYTDKGKVNGISGNVDMDISYKDYEKIIKTNGLNGFPKTTAQKEEQKVEPKKAYTGTFPKLPEKGYLENGDEGTQVRNLQKYLKWYGFDIKVDGDFREKTEAAVRKFQKAENLKEDGLFGVKSLAKARTIEK